jgi:hypothetical protein
VAGVKGTKFDLVVLEDRTARAVVQEGAISVSAMGKDVEVHAGEGTLVKQGMPPEEPRKVLAAPVPSDLQQRYTALPVMVRYAAVEGAAGYHVLLTRDREGRDIVIDTTLSPGAAFSAPELENGTYYLQVRSIDSQGLEGMEGEPSAVLVQIEPKVEAPPPAPEPVPAPVPAESTPQVEERGMLEAVLGIICVIAVFVM